MTRSTCVDIFCLRIKMCAQFVHPYTEQDERKDRKRMLCFYSILYFELTQTKPEPFKQTELQDHSTMNMRKRMNEESKRKRGQKSTTSYISH